MKKIRLLVPLAYAGFIYYLSSRTWGDAPSIPYLDKIIHVLLYLGLSIAIMWGIRSFKQTNNKVIGLAAFLLALAYGISNEIHQLYVHGRECSVFDVMADGAGAMLGVLLALLFLSITQRGNTHSKK